MSTTKSDGLESEGSLLDWIDSSLEDNLYSPPRSMPPPATKQLERMLPCSHARIFGVSELLVHPVDGIDSPS